MRDIKGPTEFSVDSRFRDPVFKKAVLKTLYHMGYDNPTMKDFNYIESIFGGRIDWVEYANFQEPTNPVLISHYHEFVEDVKKLGRPI